jgi:hypothetical protein
MKPPARPVGACGQRRDALDAFPSDHERHVTTSAPSGPVPEAIGHEEKLARRSGLGPGITVSEVRHRA